jgi:hypothetical protein
MGLGEARQEAERNRNGKDPIEIRGAAKASQNVAKAKAVMFEWCATRYMAAHEAGWRNAGHRQKWHNTLSTYAYLVIGRLPDDAVRAWLCRSRTAMGREERDHIACAAASRKSWIGRRSAPTTQAQG